MAQKRNLHERKNLYEEINRIGRGAYGTVYKAKDKNGKTVALKKVCVPLSEDGIPMNTVREIALLKQLNMEEHPNIVRLLDVCHGQQLEREITMYLVFEYVDQDLALYIEKFSNRGFSTNEIRSMSREIIKGVEFLHYHRIIHRDLKPQNILVTHDGHIKLADFGLAKTYDFEMKLTSVVVTLWYRAPEVLLGLTYATPVDIWSIGCIIAELFSLKPIFCGASDKDQLCKIFRIIGKPSYSEWPNETVSVQYNSINISEKLEISQVVPNLCENSLNMIMEMLNFTPSRRLTASKALEHPFFTEEPMNV